MGWHFYAIAIYDYCDVLKNPFLFLKLRLQKLVSSFSYTTKLQNHSQDGINILFFYPFQSDK